MKKSAVIALWMLLFTSWSFAQHRLDYALEEYRAGHMDNARRVIGSLLLSEGPDQEAATYILTRIELSEENYSEAARVAAQLITQYPRGTFAPYAHYAHAEALYATGDIDAARQELQWVTRNAVDHRLIRKAENALREIDHEPETATASFVIPEPESWRPLRDKLILTEGRIALMLSFPDPDDPAALDLERGFRFAADYGEHPFPSTVVRVHSPFEAAGAARDLMSGDELLLLLFAGDEGSAMSITLLSREYDVPVLKLTSSARPFTEFSSNLFEFLPSAETQAREIGAFAAEALENPYALVLTPESDEGRASANGFTQAILATGGTIDANETYPIGTTNVRRELARIFSSQPRLARGEPPLKALLSKKERERLFGDAEAGEVVVDAPYDTTYVDTITTREAFFFALTNENIDNFSSQLSVIPKRTTLFGNSSWLDVAALERQSSVTGGMYIIAPLLPEVPDTSAYIKRYISSTGAPPNAWELLGLDAGEYTGKILSHQPGSRDGVRQEMLSQGRFVGLSVIAEFNARRENHFARILRHRRGELITVR